MNKPDNDKGFPDLGLLEAFQEGKRGANGGDACGSCDSCAGIGAKALWIGGSVLIIAVIAATLLILGTGSSASADNVSGSTAAQGGQGFAATPRAAQPFPMAQQVAFGNLPPGCATCPNVSQCFPNNPGFQAAALTRTIVAPPINRDAIMPHAFKGVCVNCHTLGRRLPIAANAELPHAFRGVCSNCHIIRGTGTAVK